MILEIWMLMIVTRIKKFEPFTIFPIQSYNIMNKNMILKLIRILNVNIQS